MLKLTPLLKLVQAGHVEKARDGVQRMTALRLGKNDDYAVVAEWLQLAFVVLYKKSV